MTQNVHQTEETVVAVLLQLIVIVLAARLAGNAAVAVRQPRAVGEIVAGLLLGPSLFGALAPDLSAALFTQEAAAPMMVLSQIGLILLMFQIGSDFEFGHLKDGANRRAVLLVTAFSVSVPLLAGFAMGRLSAPHLAGGVAPIAYSLFTAIALAITAVPILGRILREYQMTRTPIGVIAISAAAANDVIGWVLLAAVAAFVSASGSLSSSAMQLAGLAALAAGFWFLGRPCADFFVRKFPLEGGEVPPVLTAVILALIFAAGIATQRLGIFTIFGGFLTGLLFHRHEAFVAAWRRQVGQFVLVFFLPIFFTYTGLRTNVLGLDTAGDWLWCAGFFAVAVAAKVIPVYVAGRLSGLSREDSRIIGVLMNTRALMELIVLNIGLSLGFLPQDVFTMLVIMAIGTTIMTGPLLQLLLKRAGTPVGALIDA
jgi:Kef-type K+ transport system membrane component KefB